jgi:acetyltransferase-like isoleucine patch superfamily enzyme
MSGPPELVIGDGSFIGHLCAFNIGSAIRIGKHCLLASGVNVFDMDGHPDRYTACFEELSQIT